MTSAIDDPIERAIALGEMTPDAMQAILSGEAIATEEARVVTRRFLESLIGRRKAGRPKSNIDETKGAARNFYHDHLDELGPNGAFDAAKNKFVPLISLDQLHEAVGNASGRVVKAAKRLRQN